MTSIFWKTGLNVVVLFMMLGFAYSSADAVTVRYNYTGNEFTNFSAGFAPPGNRLTGFIEVELDELGGSLENKLIPQGAAIPFFSITDGNENFNQSNVGGGSFLGFFTDGDGNIDDWFFFLGSGPVILSGKSGTTADLLPIFGNTGFFPFQDRSSIDLFGLFAFNSENPGTWVREDSDLVSSIPEPGTSALFGIGLLGLGLSLMRRRNAA